MVIGEKNFFTLVRVKTDFINHLRREDVIVVEPGDNTIIMLLHSINIVVKTLIE